MLYDGIYRGVAHLRIFNEPSHVVVRALFPRPSAPPASPYQLHCLTFSVENKIDPKFTTTQRKNRAQNKTRIYDLKFNYIYKYIMHIIYTNIWYIYLLGWSFNFGN